MTSGRRYRTGRFGLEGGEGGYAYSFFTLQARQARLSEKPACPLVSRWRSPPFCDSVASRHDLVQSDSKCLGVTNANVAEDILAPSLRDVLKYSVCIRRRRGVWFLPGVDKSSCQTNQAVPNVLPWHSKSCAATHILQRSPLVECAQSLHPRL